MKTKYIIISLCLICAQLCFSQNKHSKLFDKYADMDNVTSVYISKAMFQMMPSIGNVGMNLTNMKGKLESLQLVSTEKEDIIPQMRKEFSKIISNKHQELMRVRNGKTKATFYSDMDGDKVKDLIMLVDTDSNFTVIQLVGNFTLQDIQDIAKEMEK